MARNYVGNAGGRTGITTADTAVPAAPEDGSGNPIYPLPAGVTAGLDGATALKIDVQTPSGTTGSTTLTVYAWSSPLKAWVSEGQVSVAAQATGDFSGRYFGRATVTNWCARYAFVAVATLATGGGSGAGTSVGVTAALQDS